MSDDERWNDLVAEALDESLAEELAEARKQTGAKRRLTEKQLRQRRAANLAYAATLSLEDRRAIGRRLAEGRTAAAQRRREEREAAGEPVREHKGNRRDPSTRVLAPYLEKVYADNPDDSMTPPEARRMAITAYRLDRLEAMGD